MDNSNKNVPYPGDNISFSQKDCVCSIDYTKISCGGYDFTQPCGTFTITSPPYVDESSSSLEDLHKLISVSNYLDVLLSDLRLPTSDFKVLSKTSSKIKNTINSILLSSELENILDKYTPVSNEDDPEEDSKEDEDS